MAENIAEKCREPYASVMIYIFATFLLALRWMCDSPWMGDACEEQHHIYIRGMNKQ